ncbi:MAG TPA: magnesium transporter [Candidatus Omnitrophota bacterium]|nr:magnesium transporter [Candidatus Omnitrophota bacterium]
MLKKSTDLEKWKSLVAFDVIQAASDFSSQPKDIAFSFAKQSGIDYMTNFIVKLESSLAADVLRNLPEDFKEEVLSKLPDEKVLNLKEIFSYPEGTAGALMSKEFLAVSSQGTIKEALEYLQNITQEKKGKISYIYVVDKQERLQGVIQIRDLIFYPPETLVTKILKSPVVQAEALMSQMDVAKLLQKHHYLGIPIVDKDQRLIGVMSADSALKVFEEEAQDDIAKLVGTSPEEIKAHSVRKIVGLRLPWLFVNIISGLLCAYISGVFQNNIGVIISLFLFVPIVLGLSESISVQGATIVVRNIVLGKKTFRNLRMLLWREILVGIVIGAVCGSIVGMVASWWQSNLSLGLALAVSMTTAISISALIGSLMPIVFLKMKVDPAMASGPLVLAICDIQTLLVYFSLSSFIMAL